MSADNVALLRRWFEEVWNQGRLETIHELMAPDCVGTGQAGSGVVLRGPQEFQAFVENLRGAFPDIHVTIEDGFEADEKAAVRWSGTMTHSGDQLGVPATGKSIRISGISMVRIVNGKIVEGWDNWDQMTMMQAIGALGETKIAMKAAGQ
jgi:steroid delta-isomerase-like uncharacterized protein